MSENIIQRTFRKIRPGSGGPSAAISIVDGVERAPGVKPGFRPKEVDDEDFDDARSGMPIARTLSFGAGPKTNPIPSGSLPGVDEQGNIPFYQPDDPAVLSRLFGLKGMSDG